MAKTITTENMEITHELAQQWAITPTTLRVVLPNGNIVEQVESVTTHEFVLAPSHPGGYHLLAVQPFNHHLVKTRTRRGQFDLSQYV